MSKFLQLLAEDILHRFNGRFEQLTIIFPNKRAGLFLASELSALIQKPVWMPEIMTISEFIETHAGLKKADPVVLIGKLYKSYLTVTGSNETFDDFYFWGNMLLNDFDDIDKYMADAKALFSNVNALKEIDNGLSFLSPEQLAAVNMFWSSIHPEQHSREQEEFLRVWDRMYAVYSDFKARLLRDGLCYEGMGIRHFCEHIETFDVEKHILFAGFNALSVSERRIFSFFQGKNKASFYWDYDIYYTANEHHEAGRFLRENLRLFPNALGQEHFNNFLHNGKRIEYIAVPSQIGQAKLIPDLLENGKGGKSTAIVLCDERLLIPAVYSIPADAGKINITMGYPARNTSAAALVHLVGECRKYLKTDKERIYYYYKPVVALLSHKLIKNSAPEAIDGMIHHIYRSNMIYVPADSLDFGSVTAVLFRNTARSIPDHMLEILGTLSSSFGPGECNAAVHPIEREFVFSLYTQIQSLRNTFSEEGITPDDNLYVRIIQKIMNMLSVPFSGEPLEELQLMGLLETRMLDFDTVVLLSANEGTLPRSNPAASFIPYNLRLGFGLPTPEHQDALFVYHFYRLIQRARSIKILYSVGVKNSYEMSRYLFQIRYESGLSVTERLLQYTLSAPKQSSIEIPKSGAMIDMLHTICTQERKITPSALNIYMDCSLKFYFRYVAGIKESEEISEEVDSRMLGNIFHQCVESLYRPFGNETITRERIKEMLGNEELVNRQIHAAYLNCYPPDAPRMPDNVMKGMVLAVLRKYVRKMLEYDMQCAPFNIISMEKTYAATLRVEIAGRGETEIRIGGTIDRVDRTGEGIRVIDYKTGADVTQFKTIASLFDTENKKRNKAAFQTLLYCLVFADVEVPSNERIQPGLYTVRRMFSRNFSHFLRESDTVVGDFSVCKEEFGRQLTELLQQLFSPEHPFRQTTNRYQCRMCSYKSMCNK